LSGEADHAVLRSDIGRASARPAQARHRCLWRQVFLVNPKTNNIK